MDQHPDGIREQIHLPKPTLVPLVTGLGITVALVGLIISWWIVGAGLAVVLGAVWRWAQDVREDIAELPTERR
jgi:hypothetical protein